MSILARLGVVLGINTAEFKAGLNDATKSTKAFEAQTRKAMREAEKAAKDFQIMMNKAAVAATVAAAAIGKAFQWADEIADTADAFDVTIASLLAMQNALAASGGKAEKTADMLQKLANNAEKAREGADDTREAFTKLGIAGSDVEKLAPDELFARVAEALSKVEDPIRRNALAFEVLGKAAKGVDWKTYWEEYSTGRSASEAVSGAIKDAATAWDNLGKAGRAALEGLLVLLQPFAKFINWMADKVKESGQKGLPGSSFDWSGGGALDAEGFYSGSESMAPIPPAVKPGAAPPKTPPKTKGGYTELSKKEQADKTAVEAIKQQTVEYVRQAGLAIQRQQAESELINLTKNEREVRQALNKIEEERVKILSDINREIEIERSKGKEASDNKIKALQQQLEIVNQVKDAEKLAIEEIIVARQQEQMTFEAGWNRAYRQYIESSQDASKAGEQAFSALFGNMQDQLENFVRTGKISFKNFAASVIADLLAIQMRAQAVSMFKGFSSFFGGGGGFFSSIGSLFGMAADGGYIEGPTIVGEQGPELFVPRSNGTVIPNQQLSGHMGGVTNVTNNYINAIDTKSFEERILRSPNAVWAANKYADKSLQVGRGRS